MKKALSLIAPVFLFLAWSCGPPQNHLTDYQKSGTYPVKGVFKEPVASVVIERNGMFDVAAIMGSAFLVDKKEGIFSTARHVVNMDVEYKLFFCGKVYKAKRMFDESITDVGFLVITSDFNPSDFPESYPLAATVSVGDRAYIRGIHLHPEELQKSKVILFITEQYYNIKVGQMLHNKYQREEFTYDDLPAEVTNLRVLLRNSSIKGRAEDGMGEVVQINYSLRALDDHVISFGGLSGGPTVNERGEVIGINSNASTSEGQTVLEPDGQFHYYPVVTLNLLPVDELKRAMIRLHLSSR